jgi:proline racemase
VPPGRCDRSPCGTGTSARLAVLHARGLLKEGESFTHESIIKSKFVGKVQRTTKVGARDAIIPCITGRAWITGYKQVVLDPSDPYPTGFRVGDHWVMDS